jgi:hypothetical protein
VIPVLWRQRSSTIVGTIISYQYIRRGPWKRKLKSQLNVRNSVGTVDMPIGAIVMNPVRTVLRCGVRGTCAILNGRVEGRGTNIDETIL